MLVARYLVASESMERSGPIAAAVRSAGYVSEDEEEEDEGSSIEEDSEEEEGSEDFHHVNTPGQGQSGGEEAVPAYSHPARETGIEIGHNGYAVSWSSDPRS